MNDYSQPDFYRFNEDSIKLINFVLERNKSAKAILDLGCGSGIIGIEVSNALLPSDLYLLDGQHEWMDHIKKNIDQKLKRGINTSIILDTFGNWKSERKFDLIVCNPPYFLPGHGEASLNKLRDNSRTFNLDNWQVLIRLIDQSILDTGRCYIVIKDDHRIFKQIRKNTYSLKIISSKKDGLVFLELFRLNKNGD
jgi:tRNA1Val (adenine37-N6)-methyltransferase